MTNHIHLIFRAKENNPSDVIRDFKSFTSSKLQKAIAENKHESRREWILWLFERMGKKSSNIPKRQFWQHHNKPIELWSEDVIFQKLDYIHNNPLVAGFVTQPEYWKYSSAIDFADGSGLIELDEL